MLRNWSASRLQSLIETPVDRSLCHISVALSDRWISTTPLVGTAYERQRTQSTDVSDLDVNHTLCVPMAIHIGRVSLYVGTPKP